MIAAINIIGAGKLGKTLAHLWHQQQVFSVQHVLCQTKVSASNAGGFIGLSPAAMTDCLGIHDTAQLKPAQLWLIATPDSAMTTTVAQLIQQQSFNEGDIVFHCSGALSSDVLAQAKSCGAHIASVHPIHSFACPEKSLTDFNGSYCAYEGDELALKQLIPAFERIGAQLLPVNAEQKTRYHAASVIACNYLVALLDSSLKLFVDSGIEQAKAQAILRPIVHQTVDNVLLSSATQALTGPISRGDSDTVASQIEALQDTPQIADVYKALGKIALNIAREQQQLSHNKINTLDQLLNK